MSFEVMLHSQSLNTPLFNRSRMTNLSQSNLIGNQHAIKSFERFTCTNITLINNILSHVHNQIQTSKAFQKTDVSSQVSIVGLSTESLTEFSSIIHFSSYFICRNIFFNLRLLSFFQQHLKMHSPFSFSYSWPSLKLTVVSPGLVHDTWIG